jgi:hypothetical protein
MANGFVPADSYQLEGEAAITYDVGSRTLHYRGPTRPPLRDFVEVRETATPVDTPIGRLVTATIRANPDSDSHSITILLPDVNLRPTDDNEKGAEAPFETVAVWTTTRSSIGGPRLVEGPIHSYTQADMTGTARLASAAAAPCTFTAVLNFGLPGPDARPGRLRVEGECVFPTTGYTVELIRHEPQGSNREDLLLRLVVTPPGPDDIVGQAFTTYPVCYEDDTTVHLRTVTILPDGPSIEVQIIT